ncbi:MAG TPA: flagellar export chaperone FliS [Terracidiphilus sp.]|jgi:flagellar protein FliS|nr:flagellar export chaperone FliS [Terracidiphilus sp.]
MNRADLAYRKTAVAGASGFGLLIALYDTLAGNLRRAAVAQREGNIEQRAQELKHALLVVGNLENWVESDSGDLARSLISYYARLRKRIVEAQVKQSAEMLEEEMAEALRIREIWQRFEQRATVSGPEILPPERIERYNVPLLMQMEQSQLSWSA